MLTIKRGLYLSTVLLTSQILISCALSSVVPMPSIETPEVPGAKRGAGISAGASSQPVQRIYLIEDASLRPPNMNTRLEDRHQILLPNVALNFSELAQVKLELIGINGAVLTAKFQILGDNLQTADAGNFSWSLYTRYAYFAENMKGKISEISWKALAQTNLGGIGTSVGYRFSKIFLTYLGYTYDYHNLLAAVHHGEATGTPAVSYERIYNGNSQGLGLGVMVGNQFAFVGNLNVVKANYGDLHQTDFAYIYLGFQFNQCCSGSSPTSAEPAKTEIP